MSRDYRYEIKFVVNDAQLSDFYRWMWTKTPMYEAYSGRSINSLYFDDNNYQSIKDNLAGLANRAKHRYRWYGDQDEGPVVGLKLEKKIREGRLGYKSTVPIPELQAELLSTECRFLAQKTDDKVRELGLLDSHFLPELKATLQVKYFRNYFSDRSGIRITVDQDVEFYNVDACATLFNNPAIKYSMKIVEFKFAPELKNTVSRLLESAHFVPRRFSKYLHGMAMNGFVVYL